jgi:hypothetical protein
MMWGMRFDITLLDQTTDVVYDADGYAQEGPLTTFFRAEAGRPARLDPWATRLLSVRTDRIARIAGIFGTDDASAEFSQQSSLAVVR